MPALASVQLYTVHQALDADPIHPLAAIEQPGAGLEAIGVRA